MIKKSRVVAIKDSFKVKLSGPEDSTSLAPPPLSPTPPRKYKWARGDSGIWKKVYLDESPKPDHDYARYDQTFAAESLESSICHAITPVNSTSSQELSSKSDHPANFVWTHSPSASDLLSSPVQDRPSTENKNKLEETTCRINNVDWCPVETGSSSNMAELSAGKAASVNRADVLGVGVVCGMEFSQASMADVQQSQSSHSVKTESTSPVNHNDVINNGQKLAPVIDLALSSQDFDKKTTKTGVCKSSSDLVEDPEKCEHFKGANICTNSRLLECNIRSISTTFDTSSIQDTLYGDLGPVEHSRKHETFSVTGHKIQLNSCHANSEKSVTVADSIYRTNTTTETNEKTSSNFVTRETEVADIVIETTKTEQDAASVSTETEGKRPEIIIKETNFLHHSNISVEDNLIVDEIGSECKGDKENISIERITSLISDANMPAKTLMNSPKPANISLQNPFNGEMTRDSLAGQISLPNIEHIPEQIVRNSERRSHEISQQFQIDPYNASPAVAAHRPTTIFMKNSVVPNEEKCETIFTDETEVVETPAEDRGPDGDKAGCTYPDGDKRAELEDPKKKYTWPTVAESLKRFQKSIAAAPNRGHRARDATYNTSPKLSTYRKTPGQRPAAPPYTSADNDEIRDDHSTLSESTQDKVLEDTLPSASELISKILTEFQENTSVKTASSPEHKPADPHPVVDVRAKSRTQRTVWAPPTVPERVLPPSPVITLSPDAILRSAVPALDLTVRPAVPATDSSTACSARAVSDVSSDAKDMTSTVLPLKKSLTSTRSAPVLLQHVMEDQPYVKLPEVPSHPTGLPLKPSSESSGDSVDNNPYDQSSVTSPRSGSRRNMQSAKLISVSVWDTHDGDKNRPSRRLWTPEEKPILAGISEIEEVHGSQDGATVQENSLDPAHLQPADSCHERVRASRSPVRPHKQRKSARRSLSLPSGGLSYGDVKILYKDGHFVTVGGATTEHQRTDDDEDKVSESPPKRNLSSSLKEVNEEVCDQDGNMRAEILSLLEQGITDPQQASHWEDIQPKPGAPIFLSLPRRRQKGPRPVSVDEVRLMKFYSKSQQSLVSHAEMERRKKEGDGMQVKEGSSLKRNKSFTEAMGSNLMLNNTGSVSDVRDTELCDSGIDDSHQRLFRDESQHSLKARSKGPGFIQRMLKKRKGSSSEKLAQLSSNPSKEDLSSSSLSLASSCNQPASTSPNKRDSSLPRKMSFRGIFKRKNSSDLSVKKSPTPDDNVAPFCEDSIPHSSQRRLLRIGEADLLHDEAVTNDECDSLSPTSSRSRSPRTPLSNSSSQSSLYHNQNHEDSDRTPTADYGHVIHRRSRSSSGRSRHHNARLSGDSFSEYDMEFQNSEDTLTPRSISPGSADVSAEGERTLVPSPASPNDRLSPPIYQTLSSSPQLARRRRSKDGVNGHTTVDRGEITSSNSNDSGIQNDVIVTSSAESIQATVKLRKSKSPSPVVERPKSDITVRWADLLEQVMDTTSVKFRKDAIRLHKRPRPKSDIGGCHTLDSQRAVSVTSAGSVPSAMNMSAASSDVIFMQSGESLLSLVELRRPARDVLSAKLAKFRRLSTPQPITLHAEKPAVKPCKSVQAINTLKQAHSMPDNLDKLARKKHYFSLIGSDTQSITSQQSGGDESSDESEYSVEYPEKSLSARSSHVMLAALDQMYREENLTYAEALWDHVTMDPNELGFRAGDLICVTDATDKHWWFGVLDGHEGWFPTNYVRLRVNQDIMEDELTFLLAEKEEMVVSERVGSVMMAPNFVDKHQARANVVNEIISAEREYVKHLRDVVEGYVKQARKRPEMFPIEKVTVIFSNIEEIYEFARQLLDRLECCINHHQPHLSQIGQCFLDKVKGFEMYSDYCNNHPAACEELRELYRNKRYRHFFEACRLLQEMIEIPLEGFLLTPVQKICKYHLQLAELLKFTPPDHPDFHYVQAALEAMKQIALLINERKRKMESIEKLAAWQLLVDDWEGPDTLEHSSELIYSGELNKINHAGWSQERYFFLFDHQLIYCKKDLLKKSSFCYKGRIEMDYCQVINVPDGRDPQYNVSVRNAWKLHDTSRQKWYLLVAKTSLIKQRWLKAFQDERRRVKDDAENNFNIPAHVKQNIITNFRLKTNHNKPKGKNKFLRTSSTHMVGSTANRVGAIATLPRTKGRHKVKSDSTLGKKINWFFLGKGKS
ncbi:uncharacterized protein LOC131955133 isoform X2 [Physella acuta]|uniref:uncharacterized protein LOC131955133 isoform X2 n=1 Tax=Physella acuta TaxID=109671 RepID=UPI0027DB4261|nr:uncharacterized protein LOC131955133 isoform X2 [Physella acuta]